MTSPFVPTKLSSSLEAAPLSTASASSTQPRARKPYLGSCHCGAIQYIAYLSLPPPASGSATQLRAQKCNCTTCHKFAVLHLRFPDAPEDFMLLRPLDPLRELGDYMCLRKNIHWLFCRTCAARCFAFIGEGEIVTKDVPLMKVPKRDEVTGEEIGTAEVGGRKMEVWAPKKEGWKEGGNGTCYLSVDAHTLDAKQEGLDLREWAEMKRICYLGYLDDVGEADYERPHVGGTY